MQVRGLAFDQDPPGAPPGDWYPVAGQPGVWRRRGTDQEWRSWRWHGPQAGHYPGVEAAKAVQRAKRASEAYYGRQLRGLSQTIGNTVRTVFDPEHPAETLTLLEEMLQQYRDRILRPWAESVVQRMLADVSRRDASGWHSLGLQIGRALKREVESASIAPEIGALYNYQVEQILKIPDDAREDLARSRAVSADIVRQMRGPAQEAAIAGRRWEGLIQHINETGMRIQSSVNTVARTEASRASSIIQSTRAQHIGSELFQWVTVGDNAVRPEHHFNSIQNIGFGAGIYRWSDPPYIDAARTQKGLPGTIYNCRCWAIPILPVPLQ